MLLSRLKGSGAKVFGELSYLSAQNGRYDRVAFYIYRFLKSLIGNGPKWELDSWPEGKFLISETSNLIYCPVAKVACSSFKKIILKLEQVNDEHVIFKLSNDMFHAYAHHTLTLASKYDEKQSKELVSDPRYFKFVFVRNPWDRLTSGYLNKIVTVQGLENSSSPGKEIVEQVYCSQGLKPDFEKAITFRQFAEYVSSHPDQDLDGHWRSQISFMGDVKFDFIGKFESIETDFEQMQRKLDLEVDLPWSNKSHREDSHTASEHSSSYADAYPSELRQLNRFPDYRQFYDPELILKVQQKYKEDVKRFDYQF